LRFVYDKDTKKHGACGRGQGAWESGRREEREKGRMGEREIVLTGNL